MSAGDANRVVPRHRSRYQERDIDVVDYREYDLSPGLRFRGPDPRPLSGSVAFIGAAQTFGCFVDEPFPTLVGRRLDVSAANFGWGGAGPRFFASQPAVLDAANRCDAVVLQVMSARSEDNSLFESGGLELLRRRSDGLECSARDAWTSILGGHEVGAPPKRLVDRALRRRLARRQTSRIVTETRSNWIASYLQLIEVLNPPTLLLWFSTRSPDYAADLRTLGGTFGAFPQLVDRAMLDEVGQATAGVVEVVSSSGLPQPLFHQETGAPVLVDPANDRPDLGGELWTHNSYYPSPEMHVRAADALVGPLRAVLSP